MDIDVQAYSTDAGHGDPTRSAPTARAQLLRLTGGRFTLLVVSVMLAALAGSYSQAKAVVHVDPSGPAGQQYALPLDSVRGLVSGNLSAGVPGSQSEPPVLFGEGVRPASSSSKKFRPEVADRAGTNNGNQVVGKQSPVRSDRDDSVEDQIAALTGDDESGTAGASGILAVIAGMMVLGLSAGWLGRRAL